MSDVVHAWRPQFPIRIPREVIRADQLMKDATKHVAAEPGQGLKGVQVKTRLPRKHLIRVVIVEYTSEGGFDYGEDGPQPGELPTNEFTQVTALTENSALVFTLSFFEPLTFAELADLDTLAKFVDYFFSGDDSIRGGDAWEQLNGYGGADRISGGGGDDDLLGGDGDDSLNGDAGNDTLNGGSGADFAFGGDGNDLVQGDIGFDSLLGGNGNDVLNGGEGNDLLNGGFGRDTLTGGAGADVFTYGTLPAFNGQESGAGFRLRDVITDFRPGVDDIDVSRILTEPFQFVGSEPLTGIGQIRAHTFQGATLVEVSTDADAQAELTILLKGLLRLTETDFIV